MAAQHLPRDLAQPSSGYDELSQKKEKITFKSFRFSSSKTVAISATVFFRAVETIEKRLLHLQNIVYSSDVQFSLIYASVQCTFRRVMSCPRRPSPLACAVGHTDTFVVNAALMVSHLNHFLAPTHQRQVRGWTGRKCRFSSFRYDPARDRTSGVASPNFFLGGKMFDFRRITLFCFEKRFSKHKMTMYSKNLFGSMAPLPPGYAYGSYSAYQLRWRVPNQLYHS